MRLSQLTPDLWVAQSTIYAMNVGVWTKNGVACLIDPGVLPQEIAQVAAFLTEHTLVPRYVVITHSHYDHLLGAGHFAGATVVAQANYVAEVQRNGPTIQRLLLREGLIPPGQTFLIPLPGLTFAETTALEVGGLSIRLLHVPGHAADELALYEAGSATLWAGDMLSDAEIPFISDALAPYERSLELLAAYEIRALVPGHGRPTTDSREIQTRLTDDRRYLATLRATVTEAVRQGLSLEETVARCSAQPLHYPGNEQMHRLNVESAYAELGGQADPAEVGWGRPW